MDMRARFWQRQKNLPGGIYDHLRSGFARYSVVPIGGPHFEKMLSNALLTFYTPLSRHKEPLFAARAVGWIGPKC